MMLSIESAVAVETRLRLLIAQGFQFLHPRDDGGEIVTIVGVRAHDNVIDVVRMDGEDHVVATRLPSNEADLLAPAQVLWRSAGPACRVLDDMLDLPDDFSTVPIENDGPHPGQSHEPESPSRQAAEPSEHALGR